MCHAHKHILFWSNFGKTLIPIENELLLHSHLLNKALRIAVMSGTTADLLLLGIFTAALFVLKGPLKTETSLLLKYYSL